MLIAVLFESSRVVASAFEARGHDAVSVDFKPAEQPGQHWQGDVFDFVRTPLFERANLVIWHPPCTYLATSGIHWNARVPGRNLATAHALDQIRRLRAIIRGKRSAMENPRGVIGPALRWPGFQTIQPYHFGDDASKETVLRLDGLMPLIIPPPAFWHPGRLVEWPRGSGQMVRRWANQKDDGQNAHPESAARAANRSRTYPSIAKAFADAWG